MTLRRCDLCGHVDPEVLLRSPRLDGPLVRCPRCGLVYVGERERDFTFSASDPERTASLGGRVDALGIVDRAVEEAERGPRADAERERLSHLLRHAGGGRLLDVGCALGGFLAVAGDRFDAYGIEPDPGTAERARARGLQVITGTLAQLAATPPERRFDVATLFHVIEHLDSPRQALTELAPLIAPGGLVMIETPTVENPWFRVAPARWRQLIPDHYFFFSRATLERLLRECGFRPVEYRLVGRRVTLRFAADRLRRAGVPGAGLVRRAVAAGGAGDRSIHLNPGDIMRVVARAPGTVPAS